MERRIVATGFLAVALAVLLLTPAIPDNSDLLRCAWAFSAFSIPALAAYLMKEFKVPTGRQSFNVAVGGTPLLAAAV